MEWIARDRPATFRGIDATVSTYATVTGKFSGTTRHLYAIAVFNDADKHLVTRSTATVAKNGTFMVTGLAPGRYYVAAHYSYFGTGSTGGWDIFHGTNTPTKLAKPNLVVTSCTKYSGVRIEARTYVANTVRPALSGYGEVGDRVTADRGAWNGPVTTYTYQWLRGGKPIAGATGTTYRLKAGDVAVRLTVKFTARISTRKTKTATSRAFHPRQLGERPGTG